MSGIGVLVPLTNKQIQAKLDQINILANDLVAEGKRRWGPGANLFAEGDGTLYLLDGDEDAPSYVRQTHIKFIAAGYCSIQGGGW